MTTMRKDDNRRLVQITVKPEMYEVVRAYCADQDIPITLWARELIKKELARVGAIPPL